MILEGLITTRNADGQVHISPMGPEVAEDGQLQTFVLKPFDTSGTYRNLKRKPSGVLHITDNVLLLAQAAIHRFDVPPPLAENSSGGGLVLKDTCRWFAFEVVAIDDSAQRVRITCRVTQQGDVRPFWGFNRAKHAVLEAAILATRVGILEHGEIKDRMQDLKVIVEKTAGMQERQAFDLLEAYVRDQA